MAGRIDPVAEPALAKIESLYQTGGAAQLHDRGLEHNFCIARKIKAQQQGDCLSFCQVWTAEFHFVFQRSRTGADDELKTSDHLFQFKLRRFMKHKDIRYQEEEPEDF